jgi:hypothetical protein
MRPARGNSRNRVVTDAKKPLNSIAEAVAAKVHKLAHWGLASVLDRTAGSMVGKFGGASLSAFLHVGGLMFGLDSSFPMRLLQTTGLFFALLTASAAGVRAADAKRHRYRDRGHGATGLGDPVIPNVPAGPGGPERQSRRPVRSVMRSVKTTGDLRT